MGLGDWVPDVVEDKVEDGVEALGDVVEAGGNKVADGLDKVGWEGGADWVRDKSRSAANKLGADVAEMQLDETEDPKKLIFGSAGKIRSTASHLRDFKKAFNDVGDGLKRLDSAHWKGRSADAFREEVAVEPKKWFKAADACEKAATAMDTFAGTVEWAQTQAQEAIDAYKAAKKASKDAVQAYNKQVEVYNAAVEDGKEVCKPGAFHDPGPGKAKAAQEKLDEARRQRNEAADTARTAVKAARDAAPPKPSYFEQAQDGMTGLKLDATHFTAGVIKGGAGVIGFARSLNPLDPYNILHPAEYATGLNNTAAGLVNLASDPVGAGKQMLEGFAKDPAEGTGRLFGEALGAKGIGAVAKGARAGKYARPRGKVRESLRNWGKRAFSRKKKCSGGTDPIDLATGKMFLPQTDVALPGALPLVFTRRVESGYTEGHWFGPSWSSTADQRLEIDAEGVVFVSEDGLLLSYPHPAPDLPTLPETGPRWPLDRNGHGDYTVTDPASGHVRHFAGPSDGGDGTARLEQISDRSGNFITFEYDSGGIPTAIVHSAGYHLKLTARDGRITALHLAGAAADGTDQELIRYGYANGNLTEVVNSSGLPLRFEYDDERRVISWTDTNQRRYDYVYDNRDRCIAQGGEAGHIALRLNYDRIGQGTGQQITTVTTVDGHTTRYLFNDAYQLLAETNPLGHTTRTTYDRHDRPLTRTDPLGHTTAYTYDEAGHLTNITHPDGHETTAAYNALGLPTSVTGPDGATWSQTYDESGHRTSLTDPVGHTTRYAYDAHGHLIAITNALSQTTGVRCDAAGLPVEITDPLGATTRYQRDAFGRPVLLTDPLGHTTHLRWTVEGMLAARSGPDGTTETWTYDGEGNCTRSVDAAGGVTAYEYTHFDLLAARTGPDGVRYEFTHDTHLLLTQVTNPQGLTWSYDYDPAGSLVAETDFDNRTLTYTHDAAGRLNAHTNPLGQTIHYEHDAAGRITSKTADGRVTQYTYDPAGRLLQATGPDSEVVHQRDRMGRVKAEMVNGRVLTHAYDALGRRTRRTTPTGATTTYAYDAAGNRTTLTASGHTVAFDHDAAGREITRRIGNDLSLSQIWDPAGRLTEQALTGPTVGTVQRRTYTYRTDGYVTAIDDHLNGRRAFDLDAAGRVTTVHARGWTESYAYDEAGNQTQASWPATHAAQESTGTRGYSGTRITRAGNIRYEHDDAGRLTLRQKTRLSKKPDTWHYTWDAEDRLTAVATPDGTVWRYLYDPFGRRTAKQRLAADGETVVEQVDFTWDGSTLVEQTATTPDLPHPVTLTWDHDGLHPIAQTERITEATSQQEIDQRFFAIITDLVGTPTELVDESGDIAWHTRATLWGTTTWTADSTTYTPLRFPGQYYDPETGLHYNHHRYYDPTTARYLTPDPLGLIPAPNPATYVHNPHTWADPLGLSPCPSNVALGIREHGLREFAESNNFTHYLNDWHTWEAEVRAAAHNPEINLHISMDGFSGRTPAERFMNAYKSGMGGDWFATEREMYHVGKAVRLQERPWDSITFYENGKPVTVPEPESWPMPGR